eukprot:Rmarinus@m.12400
MAVAAVRSPCYTDDKQQVDAFERLKKFVRTSSNDASQDSLRAMVMDFRNLTMSVTASHREDDFAIEVYEVAADGCLLAGDMPEFFKNVVRLVGTLYPAVKFTSSRAPSTSQSLLSPISREAEFCGYLLLYFACAAADNPVEIAQCLRRIPQPLRKNSNEIRFALKVLRAVETNDYVSWFRMYEQGNQNQQLILSLGLPRIRRSALRAWSNTYHSLDAAFALTFMGWASESVMLEALRSSVPHAVVSEGQISFKAKRPTSSRVPS